MFSRVCCATGWTWDYVGEHMTLPRLFALQKRWEIARPVDESVALLVGAFTTKSEAPAQARPESAAPRSLTNEELVRNMHADPRKLDWKVVH